LPFYFFFAKVYFYVIVFDTIPQSVVLFNSLQCQH